MKKLTDLGPFFWVKYRNTKIILTQKYGKLQSTLLNNFTDLLFFKRKIQLFCGITNLLPPAYNKKLVPNRTWVAISAESIINNCQPFNCPGRKCLTLKTRWLDWLARLTIMYYRLYPLHEALTTTAYSGTVFIRPQCFHTPSLSHAHFKKTTTPLSYFGSSKSNVGRLNWETNSRVPGVKSPLRQSYQLVKQQIAILTSRTRSSFHTDSN